MKKTEIDFKAFAVNSIFAVLLWDIYNLIFKFTVGAFENSMLEKTGVEFIYPSKNPAFLQEYKKMLPIFLVMLAVAFLIFFLCGRFILSDTGHNAVNFISLLPVHLFNMNVMLIGFAIGGGRIFELTNWLLFFAEAPFRETRMNNHKTLLSNSFMLNFIVALIPYALMFLGLFLAVRKERKNAEHYEEYDENDNNDEDEISEEVEI